MIEAVVWAIFFGFTGFLLTIALLEENFGFFAVEFGILVWIIISGGTYIAYEKFMDLGEILVVISIIIAFLIMFFTMLDNSLGLLVKFLSIKLFILYIIMFLLIHNVPILNKEKFMIIDKESNRVFEASKCKIKAFRMQKNIKEVNKDV